jgi:phospholipid transport system substrate-binding protein
MKRELIVPMCLVRQIRGSVPVALALAFSVVPAGIYAETEPLEVETPIETVAEAPDPGSYEQAGVIVSELHEKLLHVMRNARELGYQGRFHELEPTISTHFDTPTIVRVILSRHWNDLSDEQRDEFIRLFNHLSVATYASRFDGYDGELFREVAREQLSRGRLLIRTELRRTGDDPVRMDYLMHRTEDGNWLIISVIADGVNDLALKRAEYASVIRNKGYGGLVADLQQKIREMEGNVRN